jgi:hypothetical protein
MPDGQLVNLYPMDFTVQPPVPAKPDAWEYMITEPQIDYLRELGIGGWELVAVEGHSAYLRRLLS